MKHFIVVIVLLHLFAISTSQSSGCADECILNSVNGFRSDYMEGRLNSFARCLHDANCLSAGVLSQRFKTVYCPQSTCTISCSGMLLCNSCLLQLICMK